MTHTALIERIHRERIIGMHKLADWWFDTLLGPNHDNGDRSFTGFAAGMLAGQLADRYPIREPEATRLKFRDALIAACQPPTPVERKRYDGTTYECSSWSTHISTDYGPDSDLAEAMEACGIHKSRAPWKTHSSIRGAGLLIEVSAGYQAPHRTIYVAPVLDELVRLGPAAVESLFPRECDDGSLVNSGNMGIGYVVSAAATTYASHAVASSWSNPAASYPDAEYAADAIKRLRDLAEAATVSPSRPSTTQG